MTPVPSPARTPRTGVLLLNLGGPDSLDAVEPFLVNLFSDPFLIRLPLRGWLRRKFAQWVAHKRAPHVRQLYSEIGGRSPIEPITRKQAPPKRPLGSRPARSRIRRLTESSRNYNGSSMRIRPN